LRKGCYGDISLNVGLDSSDFVVRL